VRSRRMVKTKKIGGGVWCPPSPFTKNLFFKKEKREENKKRKKTIYSSLFLVFLFLFLPLIFFFIFLFRKKMFSFFP